MAARFVGTAGNLSCMAERTFTIAKDGRKAERVQNVICSFSAESAIQSSTTAIRRYNDFVRTTSTACIKSKAENRLIAKKKISKSINVS